MRDTVTQDGRMPFGDLDPCGVSDAQARATVPVSAGEGENGRERRCGSGDPFSCGVEFWSEAVVVGVVELSREVEHVGVTGPAALWDDVKDSGRTQSYSLVDGDIEDRFRGHINGFIRCSGQGYSGLAFSAQPPEVYTSKTVKGKHCKEQHRREARHAQLCTAKKKLPCTSLDE